MLFYSSTVLFYSSCQSNEWLPLPPNILTLATPTLVTPPAMLILYFLPNFQFLHEQQCWSDTSSIQFEVEVSAFAVCCSCQLFGVCCCCGCCWSLPPTNTNTGSGDINLVDDLITISKKDLHDDDHSIRDKGVTSFLLLMEVNIVRDSLHYNCCCCCWSDNLVS